jgi:hypothetical protein
MGMPKIYLLFAFLFALESTAGGENRSAMMAAQSRRPIIVAGLPKTGTTTLTNAIELLGFNMGHNLRHTPAAGKALLSIPECNGIANMAEHEYETLHDAFPNATWIVLFSHNRSAWLHSLSGQLARNSADQHEKKPEDRCQGAQLIFGRDKERPAREVAIAAQRSTNRSQPRGCALDEQYHDAFYTLYYERLFDFLSRKGVPFRLIDVRQNASWGELQPLQGRCARPGVTFPVSNTETSPTNKSTKNSDMGRCAKIREGNNSDPEQRATTAPTTWRDCKAIS